MQTFLVVMQQQPVPAVRVGRFIPPAKTKRAVLVRRPLLPPPAVAAVAVVRVRQVELITVRVASLPPPLVVVAAVVPVTEAAQPLTQARPVELPGVERPVVLGARAARQPERMLAMRLQAVVAVEGFSPL